MATLAAVVSSTGITGPSYDDIYQQLKIIFWSIYGSDAALDDDTQDGQWLAALAQAIFDCNETAIAIYNAFSPLTAQGTGLSSVVKINGIRRDVSTNSTAIVTIVGTVGTQINGGSVGDNQNLNTQWTLPDTVNVPDSGTVDVTATCTTTGSTAAAAGTLTEILTPTAGWQTVTNAADAAPGDPVETDAQLRVRQTNSVALPSLTILEGIYAAVDSVTGVSRLTIYENDEDEPDANNLPGHSIAVVVEGGDVSDIVSAIALKKAPGTQTDGTVSQTVFDSKGIPNIISYYPLTVVPITVRITIHALTGYVSTTGTTLQQAVVDFVNAFVIGEDSYLARLYTPANLTGTGLGATYVVQSIEQSRDGNALAAADVDLAFNEGASSVITNVTLVLV